MKTWHVHSFSLRQSSNLTDHFCGRWIPVENNRFFLVSGGQLFLSVSGNENFVCCQNRKWWTFGCVIWCCLMDVDVLNFFLWITLTWVFYNFTIYLFLLLWSYLLISYLKFIWVVCCQVVSCAVSFSIQVHVLKKWKLYCI